MKKEINEIVYRSGIFCDVCGREIRGNNGFTKLLVDKWRITGGDIVRHLFHNSRQIYAESNLGHFGHTHEIDICTQCLENAFNDVFEKLVNNIEAKKNGKTE